MLFFTATVAARLLIFKSWGEGDGLRLFKMPGVLYSSQIQPFFWNNYSFDYRKPACHKSGFRQFSHRFFEESIFGGPPRDCHSGSQPFVFTLEIRVGHEWDPGDEPSSMLFSGHT